MYPYTINCKVTAGLSDHYAVTFEINSKVQNQITKEGTTKDLPFQQGQCCISGVTAFQSDFLNSNPKFKISARKP